MKVSIKEIDEVMVQGARWALEHGYAWPEDVDSVEGGGALEGANPDKVSHRAKQRGAPQLGTLGSGNHFLEIEVIDEVFDPDGAQAMGIERRQPPVLAIPGVRIGRGTNRHTTGEQMIPGPTVAP